MRIFVSYTFDKENQNAVDAFREIADKEECEVVTGEPCQAQPPPNFVRSQIFSCDIFAALMTARAKNSKTSAWISNEVGMAFAIDLPLLVCKENTIKDIGLAKMATGFLEFDRTNLSGFKQSLQTFLRNIKNDSERKQKRTLASLITELAKGAIEGRLASIQDQPRALDILVSAVDHIVETYELHRFAHGESMDFENKRVQHLPEKRSIAKHVCDDFLIRYAGQRKEWVFMDSGTVTYTVCEEIVERAIRIPVMTNNLGGCRLLSKINAYPTFIIPGEVESRYVAALGDECMKFLLGVLGKNHSTTDGKKITLSVVAATSVSSNAGVCGNDPRHNRLKRTLLEQSPRSVLVFEGEKLLEPGGSAIFETEANWRKFAENCKGTDKVKFVTHYPETFDQLNHVSQNLFDIEVAQLKALFGEQNVVVLGERAPSRES